ncbi:MAG: Ig-like domain-containing protein, partial [Bacteroidetes bacterium]|nr:Ig-like domain-containing protein [Bacteroidota bacterium]
MVGIAVIACTFIDCANRMPPPGGPVNRTPPAIISTIPANGSTNFKGSRIRIEFNQYVDEQSVEESIFISPYVGQLEFKWHGKKVDIVFEDTLRSNITYVVTVGTDVTGYYTKTRMAQSFTLAFSTGSNINRGDLSGSIIPRNENDTKSG